MVKDPVSARYAEALFDLVKQRGRIDAAAEALNELAQLSRAHKPLRDFLINPGVSVPEKLSALDRLLAAVWSPDVRAFVQLVLSAERAAFLAEMAEAFQELVDAHQRVVRATVRSAYPLAQPPRERLIKWLEAREQARVTLVEEVDPRLLGGVQIFVGHRILDGSVRTQLSTLRQRLKRVRVH